MLDTPKVARRDWLHGLVRCPACGNPLSADRDGVEQIYADRSPEPTAVRVEHRRCGAAFRIEFVS